MSKKKPYTNTVVLVKGSNSCRFEGTLGGMDVHGTLGENGIVSNVQTEVKTGLLESNAQETELFKRMDGILAKSPLNARW